MYPVSLDIGGSAGGRDPRSAGPIRTVVRPAGGIFVETYRRRPVDIRELEYTAVTDMVETTLITSRMYDQDDGVAIDPHLQMSDDGAAETPCTSCIRSVETFKNK